MVNEHNAFDLAKYITEKRNTWGYGKVDLDTSGRPAPKDIRVQLNSGIFVKCDVRYDGVNEDGQRRFLVIAEIDWENYHPTILWADEYPRDVTLIVRIPGMPDPEAEKMAAFMELRPNKIIEFDR